MNFDTPTSPLSCSVDVIATIMFGSLGHWTTDSFPLEATPNRWSVREGINIEAMSAYGTTRTWKVGQSMSALDARFDKKWKPGEIEEVM